MVWHQAVVVEWDAGAGNWVMQSGMGYPRVIGASTGEIEEDYAELRWVSPSDQRLRYVVGRLTTIIPS